MSEQIPQPWEVWHARFDFSEGRGYKYRPDLIENVVYNELRYRGFSVDVGVVKSREYDDEGVQHPVTREVDFVANLAGRRYCIQSAFVIPDAAKAEQEKASLLGVDDSFRT